MNLKPQDILVLVKVALAEGASWTYAKLAEGLGMSVSEVHAAVKRAEQAGLMRTTDHQPNRQALLEFLIHGLKYVFVPEQGGLTRGMPTGYAAPPLSAEFRSADPPPVWPDPLGTTRGQAFSPLYRSATHAARSDPKLYECLALIDAIRAGRARERRLAEEHLCRRIGTDSLASNTS